MLSRKFGKFNAIGIDGIRCPIHDLLKKQHELATIFKQSQGLRPRVHLTCTRSDNDDPVMTSIFIRKKDDKQVMRY